MLASGFALTLSIFVVIFNKTELAPIIILLGVLVCCLIFGLHARFLREAQHRYKQANIVLQAREKEFQSLFENAPDTILVLDDEANCMDANPAALRLLRLGQNQLVGQSIEILHPNRAGFRSAWECLLRDGSSRWQAELRRGDCTTVTGEFTAVANFLPGRHMMILRDLTERLRAEEAILRSLRLARSARQEADAQCQATLALTQDLRMDYVLDTLLDTLHKLVPFKAAQVFLLETESKLFLAREALPQGKGQLFESPKTLGISEHPILSTVLAGGQGTVISDTLDSEQWRPIYLGTAVRSWIGVPLLASNSVLGLLSLCHSLPGQFSSEHHRMTRSLAIPAALAIQNARLYERAQIYGTELERRLSDLHEAKQALEISKESLKRSEERFQKLFRWTPIAFSVTTLAEGRFIDVNEAFEHRYGYRRAELVGRTSTDMHFWENPVDRLRFVGELQSGGRVRQAITRFRGRSGELKLSFYSAESIQLDGQICVLAIFDDPPQDLSKQWN